MTAYELMDRICVEELLEWVEYDQCYFDDSWNQHAQLCELIEAVNWKKGCPKPDSRRYLPQVKRHRSDKDRELIDQLEILRASKESSG